MALCTPHTAKNGAHRVNSTSYLSSVFQLVRALFASKQAPTRNGLRPLKTTELQAVAGAAGEKLPRNVW